MAALRDHEKEQANSHREAMQSWTNAHALWKGERDRILRDAVKGKGENRIAAQADLNALGKEPAAPPSADRTVSEPTFEGLTKLFATGQPSLGLFSDEGGQFLGGYAMNSDNRQKTLAALNDLWQGNEIKRTRAGDGHATLYGRRLAVHLMVQPIVAQRFMADPLAADTGFLPRFLICEPQSTIGNRLQSQTQRDDAALNVFSTRLQAILDTPLPMDAETRELSPRTLALSHNARAQLIEFSDATELAQALGGDLSHIRGTASKAAEQAARLAGVLTLWEDLEAAEIQPEIMAQAIELARFYLSEASRLANAEVTSKDVSFAERLRKWIIDDWPHTNILVRDVLREGPNAVRSDGKTVRTALRTLEAHRWLVRHPTGVTIRGMKRKEAWRIVRSDRRAVHGRF
jgi:hypothetical protein